MVSSRKTCRLVESWRKLEFGFEAIDEGRNDVSASEPNEVHWMSKLIAATLALTLSRMMTKLQVTTTSHNDKPRGANGSRKNLDGMLDVDASKVHLVTNQANHENHQNHPKIGFKLLNIIVVMLNYPKIQQFSFDSSTLLIKRRFLRHWC